METYQALLEAAFYIRANYTHERLYCPRDIEETLEQIDTLANSEAPQAQAAALLAPTLALRARLPEPLSDPLTQIFAQLEAFVAADLAAERISTYNLPPA